MQRQQNISAKAVGARLRRLRATESQKAFGARFGIKQAALSTYELGRCELPLSAAVRIADGTATNLVWLITGEGRQPLELAKPLTKAAPVADPSTGPDRPLAPDRRAAEALAAFLEEYGEASDRGRESLLIRFYSAYPELKARGEGGWDRGVARVERG